MRFPSGLRALRHRDFRFYWTGQLISLVGRWMQSVAQSWLVLELTNSPLKLGIVGALQFAPILVLSFVAGAIADRVPKRPLIIATQLVLMLPAFALAALIWGGHVQYWHVVVGASMIGVVNALDMPARQSLIAELVGRDDLVNAIALNSAMFNAARVAGPALGGLLIARYGVALAFFLNGLTFLAVVAALLAMRVEGVRRAHGGTTLREEIGDGLRYAVGSPLTSLILSLVLAVSVFVINHTVLVPLLARDVLGEGVEGFGLLMAVLGGGALVGAVALAGFGRGQPSLAAVVVPAIVVSAGTLSLAAVRQFWVTAILLFIIGGSQILFLACCNTTLQVTAPDELRGRVMSLYTLVFVGVTPIGAFLIGSIAEGFGVSAACLTGGGLGLLCVLALWARSTRRGLPTVVDR